MKNTQHQKVFILFESLYGGQLKNMQLQGVFSSMKLAKEYAAKENSVKALTWDDNWNGDGTPGVVVTRKRAAVVGGEEYKTVYFIEEYFIDPEVLNKRD